MIMTACQDSPSLKGRSWSEGRWACRMFEIFWYCWLGLRSFFQAGWWHTGHSDLVMPGPSNCPRMHSLQAKNQWTSLCISLYNWWVRKHAHEGPILFKGGEYYQGMVADRKAIILHLWDPRNHGCIAGMDMKYIKHSCLLWLIALCILNAVRICKRNLSLWPTDRKHGCSLWIGVGLSRASHCRRRVLHLLS